MKSIFQGIIILSATVLASCEKVVDIAVGSSHSQIVIEAVLSDNPGGNQVKISTSRNYNESNEFEAVQGATVRIIDEYGSTIDLDETQPGIYNSALIGVPGKTYTLQVLLNGVAYSATSKMPNPVEIDQLYVSEMSMGSEQSKYVNVVYTDPSEVGNYFRFVQFVNGKKEKTVFTRNDDLSNDRLTSMMLFNHGSGIKSGDTVRVQMQSIDSNVYGYWFSLSQAATGSGSNASPANPVSNISNGALGYFSAHSSTEKEIYVP